MSLIDITQATVRDDGPGYNKFDIPKDNLKARILIPSGQIAQHFVHSLYRSEAVMKEENGRARPQWENSSYAGSFICTGNFEKVAKSTSYGDPENCAACASMHNGPKVASAPKKTFAMNVLQYQTAPNSTEVVGQSVEAKLWKHGDDKKITPILTGMREYDVKDIKHLDFLIECPADGVQFKKWQITPSNNVAYAKAGNETLKASVVAAIDKSLYDGDALTAACGEKVTAEQLATEVKAAIAAATAGRQVADGGMFVAPAAATPAPSEAGTTQLAPATEADLGTVDAQDIDSLL